MSEIASRRNQNSAGRRWTKTRNRSLVRGSNNNRRQTCRSERDIIKVGAKARRNPELYKLIQNFGRCLADSREMQRIQGEIRHAQVIKLPPQFYAYIKKNCHHKKNWDNLWLYLSNILNESISINRRKRKCQYPKCVLEVCVCRYATTNTYTRNNKDNLIVYRRK